ncbi:MAG: HAMP domain-containing sensor histidine kinase [Xanthomonadales bacterium]|jgi:signal transduction histidine kinase|nr:HAMP domain-containing sensor histidine kinase [Xanthomonadales bacterium]
MIGKSKSLTFRIILLSGTWIIMALIGTGAVLVNFYRDHIESHYDAHVLMHMEEMVSAARLGEDGELELAYAPSDPRYQVKHSGWYWEIRHGDQTLASSPSLNGETIELGEVMSAEHPGTHVTMGPANNSLRVQTMRIPAGIPGEHLILVASAPMVGITDDVIDVAEHIAISFSLLGLGLLLAVVLQIRIALKPLHDISNGISDIHQGNADEVEGEFPRDVQPLVNELNNLLEHNSVLLRRARNQLGDLAHSIKNPLTVINNEARGMSTEKGPLILKQTADIAASVDHHLSRARAFGTTKVLGSRTKVKPVAEDLVFALKRIYKYRNLMFDLSGLGDCAVRCETQDLEELLGNLMDNACKWTKTRVVVHCKCHAGRCYLLVEDDGPGIPEDQIETVLQRGQRLDESKQGHGLGLGIVQDHVELYRGKLTLSQSTYGGLCAELNLPGA